MTEENGIPVATLSGNEFHVMALGRSWFLRRDFDLETIWNEMGEDDFQDERIPYWTELWPASLVLAGWLARARELLSGKTCVDLGCGLGLTAILGQWLGADVIACDYEMESLIAAAENARRNGTPQPAWLCMDWRGPALAADSADLIWGGDILYEKRACEPILDLIALCLKPGGRAWIADPGRGVFGHFRDLALEKGFQPVRVFRQTAAATRPQEAAIPVNIWEIAKDG